MRVLLDECLDWRLGLELTGHETVSVPRAGWAGIKNGRLLALAEKEFDVFLTVDRNMTYQQHLPDFRIAVLVVSAPSNRLRDLLPLVPAILAALPECKAGLATQVRL